MLQKISSVLYKILIGIPIIGDVLLIVNGYAYEGEHGALINFAPMRYWVRRIIPKLLICALFSLWMTDKLTHRFVVLPDTASKFTDMLIGIFPNLLGFGIGVYALIFALPESFFKTLRGEREKAEKNGVIAATQQASNPPNMINVDMAYPLVIMALSIAYGAFAQFFASMWTFFISILLLAYCFVLMLELVSLIYVSAYKSISDKQ